MSSLVVFAIFCAILYFIHRKLRENVTYFKYRKIVYDEPAVIFGNVGKVFFRKISFVEILTETYERHVMERYQILIFLDPLTSSQNVRP